MSTRTDIHRDEGITAVGVEPLSVSDVAAHWGKIMTLGVLTMVLGLVAIAAPHFATLAAELLVGALLLVNGIFEAVHASHMRGRRGQTWRILGAVVALALGAALLLFPMAGIIGLTLVVAAFFIAEGVIKSVLAFQLKPLNGWGWLLTAGVLALVLGLLIVLVWPEAAPWLLGLLLGIDLLFGGLWLVLLAAAGKRWAGQGA